MMLVKEMYDSLNLKIVLKIDIDKVYLIKAILKNVALNSNSKTVE